MDDMSTRETVVVVTEQCDACGQPVPIGGWPWCASPQNPEGHAKGVNYSWKAGFSMRTQGWTRRLR